MANRAWAIVLRPGFMLPPLMFSEEEIEALVLGSRWVADRADSELASAARNVLAKIGAVLPADLRHELDSSALLVGPGAPTRRRRRRVAEDSPRHPHAAQARHPVSRHEGRGDQAHHLAVRARLLRPRARGSRLVRAAARPAAFPHGSNRGAGNIEDFAIRARARRCSRNGAPTSASRSPEGYCHFLTVASLHARRTSKPQERHMQSPTSSSSTSTTRRRAPRFTRTCWAASRSSHRPPSPCSRSTRASCSDCGRVTRSSRRPKARAAARMLLSGRRQGAGRRALRGLEQTRAADRAGTGGAGFRLHLRGAGSGPAPPARLRRER